MIQAREWSAFAGALLSLMGVSLVAGARRGAEDALSWQKEWRHAVGAPEPADDPASRRRRIELWHRFGGLFLTGIGLGLLWSAVKAPVVFIPRGGRDSVASGVVFLLIGAVMGFNAWSRRRRAPRFLDGILLEDGAPLPPGERVAGACAFAMVALLVSFGARLLREGLR